MKKKKKSQCICQVAPTITNFQFRPIYISIQTIIGQAGLKSLATGDGNDSTDSQVALGVANVYVDEVVL